MFLVNRITLEIFSLSGETISRPFPTNQIENVSGSFAYAKLRTIEIY